jgi:hypothetical protein
MRPYVFDAMEDMIPDGLAKDSRLPDARSEDITRCYASPEYYAKSVRCFARAPLSRLESDAYLAPRKEY